MRKYVQNGVFAGAVVLLAAGFGMTAHAASGWGKEGDEWHYYQSDGSKVTDEWKKSGNDWFYLDENGDMAVSRLIESDDNYYYVRSNGARAVNQWRVLPNPDADESDEPENAWYYFSSMGKAYKAPDSGKTSFKTIRKADGSDKKYAFDSQGRMLFGWVGEDSERLTGDDAWREGIYYCGEEGDGAMAQSEWRRLEVTDDDNDDNDFDDTYWFYFQSSGKKVKNTQKTINGGKYLFAEDGNAKYRWAKTSDSASPSNASPSNAGVETYFKRPEQCYMAVGWFTAVPSEEADPEGYQNDETYWYYGLSKGGVVTSQIKTIKNYRYGFNEAGEMLQGLYKLTLDGNTILTSEKVESESDLPKEGDTEKLYYFGDSPKEGVMKTGTCTVDLDGEKIKFAFKSSGTDKGAGIEGISDGCIYVKGRLQEIEDGMRYGVVEYRDKEYLVNSSGKIQKSKKNVKDTDGTYYSSNSEGIVTHRGEKE